MISSILYILQLFSLLFPTDLEGLYSKVRWSALNRFVCFSSLKF